MTQKIRYVINPEDGSAIKQFIDRLQLLGIQTRRIKSSDKYSYFESSWNDTEIPESNMQKRNPRNAGAKLKELNYNGKSVLCGSVYLLKYQKKLSNAEIGQLLDVSESTISRRIKKHLSDGNFYEKSKAIF